jgi:hypothetical protein
MEYRFYSITIFCDGRVISKLGDAAFNHSFPLLIEILLIKYRLSLLFFLAHFLLPLGYVSSGFNLGRFISGIGYLIFILRIGIDGLDVESIRV